MHLRITGKMDKNPVTMIARSSPMQLSFVEGMKKSSVNSINFHDKKPTLERACDADIPLTSVITAIASSIKISCEKGKQSGALCNWISSSMNFVDLCFLPRYCHENRYRRGLVIFQQQLRTIVSSEYSYIEIRLIRLRLLCQFR